MSLWHLYVFQPLAQGQEEIGRLKGWQEFPVITLQSYKKIYFTPTQAGDAKGNWTFSLH